MAAVRVSKSGGDLLLISSYEKLNRQFHSPTDHAATKALPLALRLADARPEQHVEECQRVEQCSTKS